MADLSLPALFREPHSGPGPLRKLEISIEVGAHDNPSPEATAAFHERVAEESKLSIPFLLLKLERIDELRAELDEEAAEATTQLRRLQEGAHA